MGTILAASRQQAALAEAAITADGFDAIIRRHQRRVYRVIFLLLRDADAADTLTQECFLRAYLKRKSFRGESSLETWLLRIAVNLAKDHGKNRRAWFWRQLVWLDHPERGGELPAPATQVASPRPSPEEQLLAREEVRTVWQALDVLSEQQRAVFLLRFAEEMPLEEVGDALGIKVGTVKAQLARATRKIRQILKERRRK
jgi:RNA polymerase sigma-70 factor, ECF subfamily